MANVGKTLTEEMVLAHAKNPSLETVRSVSLWGSDIVDVSLAASMPNLQVVLLSVNRIKVLTAFRGLSRLSNLNLRKNEITDLEEILHLRGLPSLKTLCLSENPCVSLPHYRHYVLHHLRSLEKLDDQLVSQAERDRTATAPPTCIDAEKSAAADNSNKSNSGPCASSQSLGSRDASSVSPVDPSRPSIRPNGRANDGVASGVLTSADGHGVSGVETCLHRGSYLREKTQPTHLRFAQEVVSGSQSMSSQERSNVSFQPTSLIHKPQCSGLSKSATLNMQASDLPTERASAGTCDIRAGSRHAPLNKENTCRNSTQCPGSLASGQVDSTPDALKPLSKDKDNACFRSCARATDGGGLLCCDAKDNLTRRAFQGSSLKTDVGNSSLTMCHRSRSEICPSKVPMPAAQSVQPSDSERQTVAQLQQPLPSKIRSPQIYSRSPAQIAPRDSHIVSLERARSEQSQNGSGQLVTSNGVSMTSKCGNMSSKPNGGSERYGAAEQAPSIDEQEMNCTEQHGLHAGQCRSVVVSAKFSDIHTETSRTFLPVYSIEQMRTVRSSRWDAACEDCTEGSRERVCCVYDDAASPRGQPQQRNRQQPEQSKRAHFNESSQAPCASDIRLNNQIEALDTTTSRNDSHYDQRDLRDPHHHCRSYASMTRSSSPNMRQSTVQSSHSDCKVCRQSPQALCGDRARSRSPDMDLVPALRCDRHIYRQSLEAKRSRSPEVRQADRLQICEQVCRRGLIQEVVTAPSTSQDLDVFRQDPRRVLPASLRVRDELSPSDHALGQCQHPRREVRLFQDSHRVRKQSCEARSPSQRRSPIPAHGLGEHQQRNWSQCGQPLLSPQAPLSSRNGFYDGQSPSLRTVSVHGRGRGGAVDSQMYLGSDSRRTHEHHVDLEQNNLVYAALALVQELDAQSLELLRRQLVRRSAQL